MATNFPTSVDAFVNPVSNDSLNSPSHSTQHANANDAIEAIEGYIINGTGAAWTSYTPTFNNFTLGNGTIDFAYTQIGKTVHVRGQITLGTTSVMGTNMDISTPVTASASAASLVVGNSILGDTGTARYLASVSLDSTTRFVLFTMLASGTYVSRTGLTSTVPFTWTSTDNVQIQATYEAA